MDLPYLFLRRHLRNSAYLLCSLFFPDQIGEYDGFKGYYYSRHQWIFAIMALLFVVDIADGFIKGRDYFNRPLALPLPFAPQLI